MGSDKMVLTRWDLIKEGQSNHSMRNPPIVFVPDNCIYDPCRVKVNKCVQDKLMIYADEFPPYSGGSETPLYGEDPELHEDGYDSYGNDQDEEHPDSKSDEHDHG